MANHHPQPVSPGSMHLRHHASHAGHPQVNGHLPTQAQPKITPAHLASLNENVWLLMGSTYELQGDSDGAVFAYEQALRHNYQSIQALNAISCIFRTRENFPRAVEYLQLMLKLDQTNGEVWGSLGHCYLMMEDLQQAYGAYQQALYHLRDPKEPKLWYGIGILYDRYGSLEHAEEAFSQVMHMEPNFDKANEIYFRLGIIYKQQHKYNQSLECFKYIVQNPPKPLTEEDIWFQIGHVHEQQKDYEAAKHAYQRVLERDPHHAKVLQQLGWLHHQQSTHYHSQEAAIDYLEKSVGSDNSDAQSWYLLGRCYMAQQKYPKAYEAYQQAVYRDGRNPTFWCSIGVLYYQINQYRDALDAYSRAIRLNPYISEVWYDLGTLYESCNNQTADALDAYQRAFDLDPSNDRIKSRLQLLRNGQSTGMNNQGAAPEPQDVHPQQYQAPGVNGPPASHQWGTPRGSHQGPPQGPPPGPPPGPAQPHTQPDPGPIPDWTGRHPDLHQPASQQPPLTGPLYDHREAGRPPPPQRQVSPRVEHPRQYAEQPRYHPTRRSPPLNINHGPPATYPAPPQGLPQPQPSLPQANNFGRLADPAGGLQDPNIRYPPGSNHHAPAPGAPPYGRGHSPLPEIKPIAEARQHSPSPNYHHHQHQQPHHQPHPHQPQYQHHPNTSQSVGIAAGAPAPAAALVAAEAAARDRDDHPVSGFKRMLEDDDQVGPRKYLANDEARTRLEDRSHRRVSEPDRKLSPPLRRVTPPLGPISQKAGSPPSLASRSNSVVHREEQKRADEAYRPSEAAHNPVITAPMQSTVPAKQDAPKASSAGSDAKHDERKETYEAAARKMEVDEDYDDEPREGAGAHDSSSQGAAAAQTKIEVEAN